MDQNQNDHTRPHLMLAKGVQVSHYRIVEKIGAGGMGEVYLAEDTKLQRRVALKFLPSQYLSNDELKSRFLREARAIAKLNHPNVVIIHEVGEFNDRPYYAMEHVEGEPLHTFAHDKPLPVDRVVALAVQVAQGLAEAHEAGVIHRDIKASNVVVDNKGRARLLDFGLAAVTDEDKLTRTGSTMGTVAYMSPEQVNGRPADERSDLFSFGVVLYELLAGRTPFRRDSEGATLKAIVADEPEPVGRFRSHVPAELERIINKLLKKDPSLRYQTASNVVADLRDLAISTSGPTGRPADKTTGSRAVVWIAGAAVLVLAAVAVWLLGPGGDSTEHVTPGELPMLVVLPFENLGGPEDEYFADGMTDEITSRLAGIHGIGVISRTSAMTYKNSGKTLKQIGRELDVDYVLEGTVRWSKTGDAARVRITPQLVRVSDDRHLWANNYERRMTEVFEVQAEIARNIVEELGLTLVQPKQPMYADASQPTDNVEAYNAYLRGMDYFRRANSPADAEDQLVQSVEAFERALQLDPNFAQAWARKSVVQTTLAFGRLSDHDRHRVEARQAFERSLELRPGLPEGHLAAGTYFNLIEQNYERALREFDQAEEEMHSDADLQQAIGIVKMRQGYFTDAVEHYQRATTLDPLVPGHYFWLALGHVFNEQFADAVEATDRAIALAPEDFGAHALKLYTIGAWKGDAQAMRQVVLNASKTLDRVQVNMVTFGAYTHLGLWRFELVELPYEEIIARLDAAFPDSRNFVLHLNKGQVYGVAGDSVAARAQYDSAIVDLDQLMDESEVKDWDLHTAKALALAYAGRHDEAVDEAKLARELMSIDDCHW